jgi:membrane protein
MNHRTRRLKAWMKLNLNRVKLPGMQGLGLYSVLRFFVHGLREQNLQLGAMAMAFRSFFALIPGIVILFSLVPLIPIPDFDQKMIGLMEQLIPANSADSLVSDMVNGSGPGLFSISLLLLLVSAVGAVKVMIHAFYRNDDFMVKRKFLRLNLAAFGILFLLILIFIFTGAIIVFGDILIAKLITSDGHAGLGVFILRLFHLLVILLSIILSISVAYYFGPGMEKRFDFISPGSVMAGILVLLAGFGFQVFVQYFFNFELYAGLSAIMLIMIWFYWVSFVVLMGFELNRAIKRLKRIQNK